MKFLNFHISTKFNVIIFVLTFVLNTKSTLAQESIQNQDRVDSLITFLISLETSPKKAYVLNELSIATMRDDYYMAKSYAEKSFVMAKELDYEKGIMSSAMQLAQIYNFYLLNYFEAEHYLSLAVDIAEKSGTPKEKIDAFSAYGYLLYAMSNYDESIKYYKKAFAIAEESKDFDELADLNAYMADVYADNGDQKSALNHYSMAYTLFISSNLKYRSPGLRLAAAEYMRLTNNYDEAIRIHKVSLDVFNKENRPRFESYTCAQMASLYLLKGDYYSAVEFVNRGLDVANENLLLKEKLDNYEVQVTVYDSLGDYKKTYIALIKYTKLKDSLSTAQFQEQNRKFKTNYEEMLNRNKVDQFKEQEINHQLELENKNLNRNIIIGILLFVLVIVILMILRIRYIHQQEKVMKVLTLATSHSTNSIIIFDSNICVDWVNKGFERLTGMMLEDVKGQYFLDFYNGPDLEADQIELLKSNFHSGQPFAMELASFHRNSKDPYWISISVTPLYENGELNSYVSVASDISAIHNAQEALQKSHNQTILLNEIGRQITSTLSVSEIIEKVYENVNKLMDAQNLGIGIFQEDENCLFFPSPIEKGNKLEDFSYGLDNKDRLAVKCFLDNREIMVGSIEEILAIAGANPAPIAGDKPESVVYVPLISKWKTIGVISVQSFKKNAFNKKELDMVRSLATYVAIALENAGLYENMEDKVQERTAEVTKQKERIQLNYSNIKLLSETGVQISSSLNFEDVFENLYETVAKLMDAEIFGVRIYHPKINEIEYKYEIESGKRDPVMSISMDDKDNYSVWCIENKKEILINDNATEHVKYVKEIKVPSGEMPSSLIFYPMLADGKVFGVITVQSFKKNAYTPYHLALVKTLSSYSAAALNNAELYDTLESKVEVRTQELAQKNKDIMASINYARRIQQGILPNQAFMAQLLTENFVFYRPRDVISGDFYWVERNKDNVYFAVVDCTGHGVPGALMSIIGKNILDQAVNEKDIDDPSMILTFLRAGLRVAFSANDDNQVTDVEDGMDLGVCVWNVRENRIKFSGANSNMYLLHDGALEIIKGEKSGVSASDFDVVNYITHEIDILEGDIIYLSSDGYPDQFGGERMKKYSQRRFQELLLKISSMPLNLQENELEKELSSWK